MCVVKGLVEVAHLSRGGMSFKAEKEMDKEVGYYGIDSIAVSIGWCIILFLVNI